MQKKLYINFLYKNGKILTSDPPIHCYTGKQLTEHPKESQGTYIPARVRIGERCYVSPTSIWPEPREVDSIVIGDHVYIGDSVHIPPTCTIADDIWLCAGCIVPDDAHLQSGYAYATDDRGMLSRRELDRYRDAMIGGSPTREKPSLIVLPEKRVIENMIAEFNALHSVHA